jgi:hypothetical protein
MPIYGLKATVWMFGEIMEKYSYKLFDAHYKATAYRNEFIKELNESNNYDREVQQYEVVVAVFELVKS